MTEIDQHHVLRPVLLRPHKTLHVPETGTGSAGDRVEGGATALCLDQRLRRGADERDAVELEQEQVGRRVDAPERPVERERGCRGRSLGALREHDLKSVAGADMLLHPHDGALVVVPRRQDAASRRSGRPSRRSARAARPRAGSPPRPARRTAPPPAPARGRTGRASRRRRSGSRAVLARARAAAPPARAARCGHSRGSRRPAGWMLRPPRDRRGASRSPRRSGARDDHSRPTPAGSSPVRRRAAGGRPRGA